ncbi:hypothetical protein [Endozoicomonas sp.]|uniref:hypothetical protein n=1 Tax=Endozoicomonas sp. TaxID=1892382 RepID=UPI00288720BB|nr:hypothetical protein [Endozoicomonas sp.]
MLGNPTLFTATTKDWLRFDESVDTTPLRLKALELEAGFQAGGLFPVEETSVIVFV